MKVLHVLAQLPIKTGSGVYFTNVIEGLKEYEDIEQACIYAVTDDYNINILDSERQFEVFFESENLPFPIVGMSDIKGICIVSHCYRGVNDRIRIISARAATKSERKIYEQGI